MKTRYFSLVVLLIVGSFVSMQAQTFDKMWKELEMLEQKDLPKSVVAKAMRIYDKAKAEQNVPHMMKAYLIAMQYRSVLTPDSLKADRDGLEQWAARATGVEEKAMLYSILGEMTMPDDVKKGWEYLQASLKEKERLLTASAGNLEPMAKTGETSSRYFRNNLYDLLARRAIRSMQLYRWQAAAVGNQTNSLPAGMNTLAELMHWQLVPASECDLTAAVVHTYQALLEAYDKEAERSGWLLTGIDLLNYLHNRFPSHFPNDVCVRELKEWIQTYSDAGTAPEVYLALAQFLQYQDNQVECLRIVREGMARYPRYERINQLKNIEKEILNPELSLEMDTAYPGEEQTVKVRYKNLTGITLQLYKVNLPVTSAVLQNRTAGFESKYARLQREEHFTLKPTVNYLSADTTLTIQVPQVGIYLVKALPDGGKGRPEGALMYVTALKTIHRPLPGGMLELVVVDAMSGQPIPEAEVTVYTEKGGGYAPDRTYQADRQGTLKLDGLSEKRYWYNAHTAADCTMPVTNLWKQAYFYKENKKREVLDLFTDRSIYRPGQTVYVSGLAYGQDKDSTHVLVGKNYTLSLYDASHNEVGKLEVRTNEFGSFSGQFVLPAPCLSGRFRLCAAGATAMFNVEEYKRPTFEVVLDSVKKGYQEGDSIRLTGLARTFAGSSVPDAKVRYHVIRSYDFLRFVGRMEKSASWEGETVTRADGTFSVPICLEVDPDKAVHPYWYCRYRVEVDVTDGAGETRQAVLSLPLGSTSMVLSMDQMPSQWVKEKRTEMKMTAVNLSNQPVDVLVAYRVVELDKRDDGTEKEGREVLAATTLANRSFVPETIYSLPSGSYRLKASARDAQGRECMTEKDFVLFSLADKRPPVLTTDWFYQDGGEETDGRFPTTIYMGSSEKNVCLFYDVFAGNKRLESRQIQLSDSVVAFRFPYKEEYGDGILVSLAFVKRGKLYAHNVAIRKPAPEKKLQLKWTTFRDKLRPGQQEEWKLTVLYPDGRPADAEMMATLYDASLDEIGYPHLFSLKQDFPYATPFTHWSTPGMRNTYLYADFPIKILRTAPLAYSELLVPVVRQEIVQTMKAYGNMPRSALAGSMKMSKNAMILQDAELIDESAMLDLSAMEMESDGGRSMAKNVVRENFAETAFFYPQLRTNDKGEVGISFVLPESLTRWKFMGLAHSKELDHGEIKAMATASKELMLQPNMPRFVRVGDKVNIVSSLVNLSEKEAKGVVRMELFNPDTEKVFYLQKKKFEVGTGQTGQVAFSFDVSDKYALMACRIVAEGDTFSDGEQHYLPVLTDKQWVTETVPLTVDGTGAHTFSLDQLFNHHSQTASGQRMTVEFVGNPVWYAIQALPAMAHPQSDDALSWAVAYYANSLAAAVVEANPRIKQVFDGWKTRYATKEILMSRLQQNQELKDMLLAETPWLAEAVSETERMQRIAILFDLNAMNVNRAVTVEKLAGLQNADGTWSWYKGMGGNRYMTTQIIEMLARLHTFTRTEADKRVQRMYQKGMEYLSRLAAEEYKQMKAMEKKGGKPCLSEQTLRYLYICALDGKASVDKQVNQYLVDKLADKGKELTIYEKALGAIVLQQAGRVAEAGQFVQSLMEYSVATDEMGRYFDTSKASYSWFSYKIPTEVAAMEAIQRTTKDRKTIDEMKRWLLRQKQIQAWENPIATADAVYALMNTGTDWLQPVGTVTIRLGKEVVKTPADEALGYVKEMVGGDVTEIRQVTVEKEGSGMAWGAVYAQYLETMDRMKEQGNALSIVRRLYREGEVLTESAPLHVGDKIIVRLTVTADRDMDFVQIKDSRAACMEPVQSLSGYQWANGCYQATKDASTQFFIDRMRKGTYVIEYPVYVSRTGEYQAGVATVQSAYAPEFGGHTAGYKVSVR